MTLLSIRNAIVSHLTGSDTFGQDDFPSIPLTDDVADQRDPLIRTVLADLVTAGMLRAIPPVAPGTASQLWILTSPLGSAGQQVSVSLGTAIEVADEINAFIDAFSMDWPECDSLELHEGNILMLLGMVSKLRGGDDTPDDET